MSPPRPVPPAALLALALLGCGARTELSASAPPEPQSSRLDPCESEGETRPCQTLCGSGVETCAGGVFDGCTAPKPASPPATIEVQGVVRDFHDTHPDFEKFFGEDQGIVEAHLGADRKPVYAGEPTTPTTSGAAAFESWFHDVPGVNASAPYALELQRTSKQTYVFASTAFFPIDNQLFGNEGRPHNFHFTYEMHAKFLYRGGETLTFSGDDDVWVFLNDQLVIDLGGVHSTMAQTVTLDALAKALGMVVGKVYPLDLFFAERHTDGSTFRLETTIEAFDPCNP